MNASSIISACTDPQELIQGKKLEDWYVAEETILEYYKEVEEEAALPDLFGKTLLVNNKQFPHIHSIVKDIAEILNFPAPLCFIYDSQKYLIDSEGISHPRLEISSRLAKDFSRDELKHVIAKEMFHLRQKHIEKQIMTGKILGLFHLLPNLPVISMLKTFGGGTAADAAGFHFQNLAFTWFKHACFSAENFAVSYTASVKDSITATLLTIFNERQLVESIDVRDYIKQIGRIESCTGPSATLEILNEVIPYGPYRILNMLRFLTSATGSDLYIHFKHRGI